MKDKTARYVWFCSVMSFIAVTAASPAVAGANRWTNAGPDGAAITAMIADRSNPATLYAATYAGVFKSVDNGELWSPLNNGLSDQVVSALAMRPQAPSSIFAATIQGKVFRSDNSGEHWSELVQPSSNSIHSIDFAPGGGTVYAATEFFVYRSTDDGATWATASGFTPSRFLTVLPNGDVYAGRDVLFVSTDQGRTFTILTPSGFTGRERFTAMAFDSETMSMYVGTSDGVLKSVDLGKTWQSLPSFTPSGAYCGCDVTKLVVKDRGVIAATYDGVVEYTDGDKSWTRIGNRLDGTYVSSLLAAGSSSGRLLMAGTSAGFLKTAGNQGDWRYANSGLTGAFTVDVAVDPTNVSKTFAATARGIFVTGNGGDTWEMLHEMPSASSWPVAVAVTPLQPTTIFAASNDRIEKSSDAGKTWKLVTSLGDYVTSVAVSPSDTATVYAALSSGMAKSTNGGDTFGSIQSTLPFDYYGFYGSALAVDPARSSTVFVATYFGVYKSETGGSTWDLVSDARSVGALAIDASDSSNLYAAPATGGVSKSRNGGTIWNESGLIDENVVTIAIDQTHPSIVYAGTHNGEVFRSANGGGSWIPFSSGLQRGAIFKLAVDSSGERLWAATSRGVYRYERDLTYLKSAVTYTISLRTLSGNYVSAVDCGDAHVTANAQAAGPCETFTLYDVDGGALRSGDAVYLQAANGTFLAAEHGGSNGCPGCESPVVANRPVAASWETFTLRGLSGSPQIGSGAAITLQSSAGNYIVAEDGGGNSCGCDSRVKANRDIAREWETFILSLH